MLLGILLKIGFFLGMLSYSCYITFGWIILNNFNFSMFIFFIMILGILPLMILLIKTITNNEGDEHDFDKIIAYSIFSIMVLIIPISLISGRLFSNSIFELYKIIYYYLINN